MSTPQDAGKIPFRAAPEPSDPAGGDPAGGDPAGGADPNAALNQTIQDAVLAGVATALKPVQDQLGELDRRTQPLVPRGTGPETPTEVDETEFYADPHKGSRRIAEAAAERVFQERGGPAADAAMGLTRREFERDLKGDPLDAALYTELKSEFEEIVRTADPASLSRRFEDGTSGYQRTWMFVKGQNFDKALEIREKVQKDEEAAEMASRTRARAPFSEGGGVRGERGAGGSKISDEEHDVAKRLGITDEEYLTSRKAREEGTAPFEIPGVTVPTEE